MHDTTSHFVDVVAWVDSARTDRVKHRQRQATHILLAAIARLRPQYTLHLKGGLLLGLVHDSERMTSDIDLTARFSPRKGVDAEIKSVFNGILPETAAMLGYVGAQAKVCGVRIRPKKFAANIEEASFPALRISVQYVSTGSGGQKPVAVSIDVSFNEPEAGSVAILDIGDGIELHAYGPVEVIAEKYRALLQQAYRRRRRRQDVYDLDFLQARLAFDDGQKARILEVLIEKCAARDIIATIDSIDDPEVKERSGAEWNSIALETGSLPEFSHCFGNVRRFYRELPWSSI